MKIPHYSKIHNRFKINGVHYNQDELTQVAYNFIKEGEPYEEVMGVFLLDWLDSNSSIEVPTSGSTGTPKKIKVSKQAMVHSAVLTGEYFDLEVGGRALHCLPVDYIAGKMMLVRAMILGLDLILMAPKTTLDLGDSQYDFCAMVPLQAQKTLSQLTQIKTLLIGGAPLSDYLRNALNENHDGCYETYGMTETLTHIAVSKVKQPSQPFELLPEIRIESDTDNCLLIHAPHLSDMPIQTQDVVELLSAKQFHLLGRKNNIINSGGKKLFPEQMEKQLGQKINKPFFLAGQADEQLGEKLILIAEGKDHHRDSIEAALVSVFGKEKLLFPKEIVFLKAFVYTPTGKIDRRQTLAQIR